MKNLLESIRGMYTPQSEATMMQDDGKMVHNCAKHVEHAEYGQGHCIAEEHAAPDRNGNIAWYDIVFEHGVERGIPITELNVLQSESHVHAAKKPKKMAQEAYNPPAVYKNIKVGDRVRHNGSVTKVTYDHGDGHFNIKVIPTDDKGKQDSKKVHYRDLQKEEVEEAFDTTNPHSFKVTVHHKTADGTTGSAEYNISRANDARHAKNIAMLRHEKALSSKGIKFSSMHTDSQNVKQEGFDPLKHVKNPTPGEKTAAKDVKRGSYADRAAMLKSAQADGRLKEESDVDATMIHHQPLEIPESIMEADKNYDAYFKAQMKKHGIKHPGEFNSDEEKKAFFNKVDAGFKAQNEEVFLEAWMSSAIQDVMNAHKKAGNKISDEKSSTKGGEPHHSFVVTTPEGKRTRHIYHGSKKKLETMSPAAKSKIAAEVGDDEDDK